MIFFRLFLFLQVNTRKFQLMKNILSFLSCFFLFVGFVSAQKTYIPDYPEKLLDEGKRMYADKNYIGSIERMEAFKAISTNRELIREADYYIVSSSFAKNNPDAKEQIADFLEKYPSSEYENRLNFLMASLLFLDNDYKDAMEWFSKSDMFLLSNEEQEDYSFRFAYCALQSGNEKQALPFFTVLAAESERYGEPATYYKGYIYYLRKDYDKALQSFQALQRSKDYKTASGFYITQIEFIREQYDDVIFSGEKLLQARDLSSENKLETQRVVGESYYQKGDYQRAESFLKPYVSNAQEPVRSSYFMLGSIYFRQGDYRNAVQNLSQVRTDDDLLSQNTYLLLGQSYLALYDKTNARMAFESASNMMYNKEMQEIAMYNCGLLTHEMSYSAFGESVLIFERFLNTFPNSQYTDAVNNCLVETYLTTRNYNAALSSIQKIKNPSSKILGAKQNILFQLGTEAFANNNFRGAIDYFTQSIQVGNYEKETRTLNYFWRGESYYRLNQFGNAANDYETYLSNTSGYDKSTKALASYGLGYAYFKQKNYTSALKNFNNYVSTETNTSNASYPDAYNRIGDCYFQTRNLAQAEASYAKAANAGGSGDYALFQKAFVMGLQKNYNGKISTLNTLINNYPKSTYVPDAYFEKARAYVMLGQNNSAIETFTQLESKFPQSSWSRKAGLQKAMLYFDGGNLDNAMTAYKRVIANYSGSEEAKIAVQDLKTVYLDKNDIQGYADYVRTLGIRFEVSEQDSLTYLAAEKLFMRGETAKAKTALNNYLNNFPRGAFSVNARYYIGAAYYSEKNYKEALREFAYVLDAPDNKYTEDALARSAEITYNQKDYNNALNYFKQLNTKAESAENRQIAKIGIIRSASFLNKYQEIIPASNELLQDTKLSPDLRNEALFARAKANAQLKNTAKAVEDWQTLAKDTRNVYGAEAKYQLGQYYYDSGQYDKAEKEMMDYIQKGTPHGYWLARGFILVADVHIARKDYQSARQYLQSLQNNYKSTNDNIPSLIKDRMGKLK